MLCQCDERSVDHGPGFCTNQAQYTVRRGEKTIAVCGDCTLTGDQHIPPNAGCYREEAAP